MIIIYSCFAGTFEFCNPLFQIFRLEDVYFLISGILQNNNLKIKYPYHCSAANSIIITRINFKVIFL